MARPRLRPTDKVKKTPEEIEEIKEARIRFQKILAPYLEEQDAERGIVTKKIWLKIINSFVDKPVQMFILKSLTISSNISFYSIVSFKADNQVFNKLIKNKDRVENSPSLNLQQAAEYEIEKIVNEIYVNDISVINEKWRTLIDKEYNSSLNCFTWSNSEKCWKIGYRSFLNLKDAFQKFCNDSIK